MSDPKPVGADAPTLAQSVVVELVLGAIGRRPEANYAR